MVQKPHLLNFPKIGNSILGYISIAEKTELPFVVKRVFWAYYTPDNVVRGRHAHHETEMILVALAGRITITTQMPGEKSEVFILEEPQQGLYLPKYCWHTMQYSHTSVQLCLASLEYDENDYIRDYDEFKKLSS